MENEYTFVSFAEQINAKIILIKDGAISVVALGESREFLCNLLHLDTLRECNQHATESPYFSISLLLATLSHFS